MQSSVATSFAIVRHSVRLDKDENAIWIDQETRPYDTPISDFLLPIKIADELRSYSFKKMIVSPLRRCLQTASQIALTLGITDIIVDFRLSELMNKVRAVMKSHHSLSYLSIEEMKDLFSNQVRLKIVGIKPEISSTHQEDMNRYISAVQEYQNSHVLIISHGDLLSTASQIINETVIYDADECASLIFQKNKLVFHDRCQVLEF